MLVLILFLISLALLYISFLFKNFNKQNPICVNPTSFFLPSYPIDTKEYISIEHLTDILKSTKRRKDNTYFSMSLYRFDTTYSYITNLSPLLISYTETLVPALWLVITEFDNNFSISDTALISLYLENDKYFCDSKEDIEKLREFHLAIPMSIREIDTLALQKGNKHAKNNRY